MHTEAILYLDKNIEAICRCILDTHLSWRKSVFFPCIEEFFIFSNNYLTEGVLQPAVAVLVSCVLCPILSMFIAVLAVLRKGVRTVWDTGLHNNYLY